MDVFKDANIFHNTELWLIIGLLIVAAIIKGWSN